LGNMSIGTITNEGLELRANDLIRIAVINSGNVGIGVTNPSSLLHVAGSFATQVNSFAANITLDGTRHVALVDATAAARTITLPAATGISGRQYVIKKVDASANTVTVDGNASETIDGALTYVLSAQYKYVVLVSNGSNWSVIGNN